MSNNKENSLFNDYRVVSSPDWTYKNSFGTYSTELTIIEGKIIFEKAYGNPSLEDTKAVINIILEIIDQHFVNFKPYYISDTRNVKGADAEVRSFLVDFHRDNHIFESVSLIANMITRALFRIVKSLGVSSFKNWKIYPNEKNCIDEILKGEVILEQSQEESEYTPIYNALAGLSNKDISYEQLIDRTQNNEELSSVIQAFQIIIEEHKSKNTEFDLNIEKDDDDDRPIEQITNYISLNYQNSKMSLSHLSNIFPWSERFISEVIKENYPVNSFREYVNVLRIEEAKRLLIKTNKSVAEIGYIVGFNSPNAFNRVFKLFANKTPGEFHSSETK